MLEGEEFEYVVQAALESPTVERLIASAIESRLADQAVVRLLESDDLWLVVDEIASSPAVTTAIAQQSVSFAEQVAGGVRSARATRTPGSRGARGGHFGVARPRHPARKQGEPRGQPAQAADPAEAAEATARRSSTWASSTRAIAFALDAALIQVVAIAVAGTFALILSVLSPSDKLRRGAFGGGERCLWAHGSWATSSSSGRRRPDAGEPAAPDSRLPAADGEAPAQRLAAEVRED